jgi:glycosyltransferase involved in cell wall biosynthesis
VVAGTELVSVVCPVYNEEGGITQFYDRTTSAMQAITPPVNYELVFVDDGSKDGSADILRTMAKDDERVNVIQFSRNFGHQLAITAGIDHARGDAVVVIDSDLQDPPEVIAGMVDKWRDGWDVVYGQRTERPGEGKFKLATARIFYRLINRLSDVELPLDAGDFRLIDRKVVDALKSIREENRYMRGLVSWVGFKQTALPYERDERFAGETHYPLRKMMHFAADGITSFSEKPLKIAISLGTLVTVAAFITAVIIILGKVLDPDSQLPGYASLMAVSLFLGGIQLLTIGILGQYIGRTYREAKNRPLYIVSDRISAENADAVDRRSSDDR